MSGITNVATQEVRFSSPLGRARSAASASRRFEEEKVDQASKRLDEVFNPLLRELNGKVETLQKTRAAQASTHEEAVKLLKKRITVHDAQIAGLETRLAEVDKLSRRVREVQKNARYYEDCLNRHCHEFEISRVMRINGPRIEFCEKPTFY